MARTLDVKRIEDESWDEVLMKLESPPPAAVNPIWERVRHDRRWKIDLWIQRVDPPKKPASKI